MSDLVERDPNLISDLMEMFADPHVDRLTHRAAAEVARQDQRIRELEAERDSVRRENAHLRIVAQKTGCPYGHRSEGGCELGYPGCACMDDLLAMQSWCPEDEHKAAVRMGKRIRELEAKLDEAINERDDMVENAASWLVRADEAYGKLEAAEALLGKVGEVLGELIHTVIHAEGAETYTGLIRRANDLRAALHAEIIASQSQPGTEDSGGDLAGDGGEG